VCARLCGWTLARAHACPVIASPRWPPTSAARASTRPSPIRHGNQADQDGRTAALQAVKDGGWATTEI
jgi:hypothetical protein